jgi:hypothetical protein
MDDRTVLNHITELVEEEKRLRAGAGHPEDRLRAIEEELDQCWDLLRQRRALREFGGNPDDAQPRDKDTVERYLN